MLKQNKGITLIALIITIIVMMILVAVSVTVALDGGLFGTAKDAASKTQIEAEKEMLLSAVVGAIDENATVNFNKVQLPDGFKGEDGTYTSPNGNTFIVDVDGKITYLEKLPTGWSLAETKPSGWSENVTAVTDGTTIIPLPKGFELSIEPTEDSIEEGLVLKDGANEFVWIPVTNYTEYKEDSFGPLTGVDTVTTYACDSQKELDYYYGKDYYNYNDFTYGIDKTNVEKNIQTYGGFYVGRYETTIDGTIVGVQRGKKPLTTTTILKEAYVYRWWGLYKAQKDMYAHSNSVGSLMISSKQWSTIMTVTGYGNTVRTFDTYVDSPGVTALAYKTDSTKYDLTKNIYDLAGNVLEFTITAHSIENDLRIHRGSSCYGEYTASNGYGYTPITPGSDAYGSRVTLYIK